MKQFFPAQGQSFRYLQTNRSDRLGSIWSSFNLDFQSKLGTLRLANKLVGNTSSSDDADLGLPVAFEFWFGGWWASAGTRIFKNSSPELITSFLEDASGQFIGTTTTRFDVTNPSGTTFRYTYDGTGTDPGITALSFPIGSTVVITGTNLAAGNRGTFTITGSGANYFEVTNAAGVAEVDKTIASGSIAIAGGSLGRDYSISSDLLVFNDKLWATSSLYLRSKSADPGSWTTVDTFLSTVPHKMVYFKKFDRLYVVNQSTSIHSVNTSDVVATSGNYTLNPGTSIGYVATMVANTSFIWIGTFRDSTLASNSSTSETKGSIMQWDGFSQQVTNEFLIDAGGVLAMCVVSDVPYALDTEGRVLKYTGYSFQEIARLPIDRTLLINPTAFGVGHSVHFNGMVSTKNNTILININNQNNDVQADVNENLPSGIWELDLATGNFTHKYAPTLKHYASSTITDYGQNKINAVGAIKVNTLGSVNPNGRSTILAGFNYYTDETTVNSGIFIDSPARPSIPANGDFEGQKRGYFITTWFESSEITDNWNRVWATYRRFLNSSDKIVIKYRLNEEAPSEIQGINWISTTAFICATATDLSVYAGYEAEILQGAGSGSSNQITTVTFSSPSYTVNFDTAIPNGGSGSAKARFQKWIKLGEITGQVLSYGSFPISSLIPESNSSWRCNSRAMMNFTK